MIDAMPSLSLASNRHQNMVKHYDKFDKIAIAVLVLIIWQVIFWVFSNQILSTLLGREAACMFTPGQRSGRIVCSDSMAELLFIGLSPFSWFIIGAVAIIIYSALKQKP
jgi:hypothetical protein